MTKEFKKKLLNNEWKDKKWEEISEEDKKSFEEIVNENQDSLKFWRLLCKRKKCLFCKKEYKSGLIRPFPGQLMSFWESIRPDWVFHCKTTHGCMLFGLLHGLGITIPSQLEDHVR